LEVGGGLLIRLVVYQCAPRDVAALERSVRGRTVSGNHVNADSDPTGARGHGAGDAPSSFGPDTCDPDHR
jgi:hypothetical protein